MTQTPTRPVPADKGAANQTGAVINKNAYAEAQDFLDGLRAFFPLLNLSFSFSLSLSLSPSLLSFAICCCCCLSSSVSTIAFL